MNVQIKFIENKEIKFEGNKIEDLEQIDKLLM
jgi:hypothetical protein